MPDVNVWLALASRRHAHHPLATAWLDTVGEAAAVFCRVTQMGLLRLLTNRHVMGVDVLSQAGAWRVYHKVRADSRTAILAEPPGIEPVWQRLSQAGEAAASSWTDAYLQAFAALKELTVVSFDRGFRRFLDPEPLVLE